MTKYKHEIHWKILDYYFQYSRDDINVYLTHPKYVKAIKGKKTDKKILKLFHGSCKNIDKILDSLQHSNIESEQCFKMDKSMKHMEELDKHIKECEIELVKRATPKFEQFTHITEIPGIGLLSAILIVAEIGVNMIQF